MYDVIVIGAGPAGLMASITAASHHKKVLLIEKNNQIGKKLEITGGGRCNVTNLKPVKDFISQIPVNSKNLYSTLTNFGPKEIFEYFSKLGIKLKIEDDDRVFPVSNKSTTIVECLYDQLIKNNVKLNLNEIVMEIQILDDLKIIKTNKNSYETRNIIIATGGFSYPQTGSMGDGYRLAKKLHQNVTSIYPAETFLKTAESLPLEGITLESVSVSIDNKTMLGSLLFTHTGLSGPVIFKISADVYKKLQSEKIIKLFIDFIPNIKEEQLLIEINNYDSKKEVISFINSYLPKRLADYLGHNFMNTKMSQLSKEQKKQLIGNLKRNPIDIIGTGSLEQSLVTGGGVDMKNINSKTMESTINKGIYFVGEVLDIHGHTGGYNITLALSTGYTAGSSIL